MRDLMRLLHGELPAEEAARLRERLAREPELARSYRRMSEAWDSLELPPPSPVPLGFAARVAARAEEAGARSRAEAEAFHPAWVRAVGALAVAVGVTAGATLSWLAMPPAKTLEAPTTTATASTAESGSFETEESLPSLAEAYWTALGSETSSATDSGSVK